MISLGVVILFFDFLIRLECLRSSPLLNEYSPCLEFLFSQRLKASTHKNLPFKH